MTPETETLYEQALAARIREHTARRLHRFLVTSTAPGEGKSSVVVALGRALARSGTESVLLIDANPMHPDLHSLLGVSPACGLSELLEAVYFCDLAEENPTQFGLGDWLELLRAQMKTGELRVASGGHDFSIRFTKGSVTSISGGRSGNTSAIGESLVRRGNITAAQRDHALHVHEGTGRPLGSVLRMLNCVTQEELSRALLDQASHALSELIALRQPSCRFHETAEAYRPVTGGRMPTSADSGGIDELVTGMRDHLESPFLTGQLPAYLSDTALPNLKLLPGGTRSSLLHAPARLRALGLLLERVARIFDIILVDSAEIGLGTPTGTIAGLVDGALLVVKADAEDVAKIRTAIGGLREGGGQVLGVVLSQGVGPGNAPGPVGL